MRITISETRGAVAIGEDIRKALGGINDPEALEQLVQGVAGREVLEDLAEVLSKTPTPGALSRATNKLRKAGVADMFYELWINGLLSGTHTQMRNLISNTAFSLLSIPETSVAAGFSQVRRIFGGDKDSIYWSEPFARLWAYGVGAKQGVRLAFKAYITEMPTFGSSKLDYLDTKKGTRIGAIPSVRLGEINLFGQKIPIDVGGKQPRIPGRLLLAGDEFFKAIAYQQELAARAYRTAHVENLRGDAFLDRVANILNDPPTEMVKAASEFADYQTFTSQYGKIGAAMTHLREVIPGGKLIVPFLRTPLNISKRVFERTPFGLVTPSARGKRGAVAQDTALARIVVGSLVGYVGYEMAEAAYEDVADALRGDAGPKRQQELWNRLKLSSDLGATMVMAASEGRLTGPGPEDERQRAVLRADGWSPQSFRYGNMWYSYRGTEPIGMTMSMAAAAAELNKDIKIAEADKIGTLIMASVSNTLKDQTWFQGPAMFLNAFTNPEMTAERFFQSYAATLVPAIVGQVARAEDPYMREVNGMLDAIKARIPGVSKGLQPKIDIWGREIKYGGSLGPDFLSPIYQSEMQKDPLNLTLLRLGQWPSKLTKEFRGVEMTPEEYTGWQKFAGAYRYKMMSALTNQANFREAPIGLQAKMLHDQNENALMQARQMYILTDEARDLFNRVIDANVEDLKGLAR